jgi:RNA polymerase sigma-70 factor (ECF subfamily)
VDAVIQHACDVGRTAWPAVPLDEQRFRAYLAERMPENAPPQLCWADLWLACGCVDGNDAAVAALDRHGSPAIDSALAKLDLSADDRNEIKQLLRGHLLLPDGERAPRIAGYAGKGDLRGFLRVAATRFALNYLRDHKRREVEMSDRLPELLVDPELQQLQQRYLVACEEALADAIDQLGERDRNLLRQHLIEGAKIQDLAVQHNVHRVTIARWLEEARAGLLERVKAKLYQAHGVGADDLVSVVRLVRSQLDVSLSRRLGRR